MGYQTVDHGACRKLPRAGSSAEKIEPSDDDYRQADDAHEPFFVTNKRRLIGYACASIISVGRRKPQAMRPRSPQLPKI